MTGVVLVVAAAALTAWRAPVYLVAPNFWAEEGQFFFPAAWHGSWFDALVQHPASYLHLYANLATLFAAGAVKHDLISLASAPRVTAWAGLVAQMVPVAVIAFGRAPEWGGPLRRAVAIAIVLFGTRTGGIWLNSVTTQNYLALTAFLLALEPTDVGRGRGLAYGALLALCGLSGPGASFAMPLYVGRAMRERGAAAVMHASLIAGCVLVQAASFWSVFGVSLPGRAESAGLSLFAATVWKRVIVASVAGVQASEWFRGLIATVSGSAAPVGPAVGIVLLGALVAVVISLGMGLPRGRRIWLTGAFLLATVSILGAVGDAPRLYVQTEANQRYFFAPSLLFLLLVLANVRREMRVKSLICVVVLTAGLYCNARDWRTLVWWRPTWPRWADEVRAREGDPRLPLRIWPSGWLMRLGWRG